MFSSRRTATVKKPLSGFAERAPGGSWAGPNMTYLLYVWVSSSTSGGMSSMPDDGAHWGASYTILSVTMSPPRNAEAPPIERGIRASTAVMTARCMARVASGHYYIVCGLECFWQCYNFKSIRYGYTVAGKIISVASAVWIATATLHREFGSDKTFTRMEIINKTKRQKLCDVQEDTILATVSTHCVANSRAAPARYRMLYRVGPGDYRLYRKGDRHHPSRALGTLVPSYERIPPAYKHLLKWYERDYYDFEYKNKVLTEARRKR
ncbi:hypothetical protein CENSYa_2065 [Cenarchaeum symbiosum A]|uniref:DUF7669 domain-containing protein n=1 Tax=Cenarchaeum symbiosum (strain A) TaxID=414004 RepID=A0RZA1_CENSY|nr:hypothetical protein CENSYa_2065 [Cenarchaeum symbiosum A]